MATSAEQRKILFLAAMPYYQWRGSPIRLGFDLEALAELGFHVDLVTLPVGDDRPVPGVAIHRVANPFRCRSVGIGPSLSKAFFNVLIFFKALALIRRNRYAVIHCVEETAPLGAWLARRAGARMVYEKHSDPASHRGGRIRGLVMSLYARVERFAMRRADAVIVTGPGLEQQAVRTASRDAVWMVADVPSSRAEADPVRIAAIRQRLRRGEDDCLLLYVGSFASYQGVDLLFQSIPLVARRHPNARFVVIGGSAAEVAACRAEVERAGVADAVLFHDKIHPDELPHYLGACDILLSPRRSGVNTPLKLLDYLKAGRAIAATNTDANRLILDEEVSVLTESTPEAYADGMGRLIDDAGLRRRLGETGLRRLKERHAFPVFKEGLRACYQRIAG